MADSWKNYSIERRNDIINKRKETNIKNISFNSKNIYSQKVPVVMTGVIDKIKTFNEEEGKIEEKVLGGFEQFPLMLAWAVTIHKSQGQNFEDVIIDMGNGAFAHGQTYVALSRCTKLEGIKLVKPIVLSDIIFDKRIYQFFGIPL